MPKPENLGSHHQIWGRPKTDADTILNELVLNDNNDVTITGATSGDILTYDGSMWINLPPLSYTVLQNPFTISAPATRGGTEGFFRLINLGGPADAKTYTLPTGSREGVKIGFRLNAVAGGALSLTIDATPNTVQNPYTGAFVASYLVPLTDFTTSHNFIWDADSSSWILVTQRPLNVADLQDSTITGVSQREVLTYDSATSNWINIANDPLISATAGTTDLSSSTWLGTLFCGVNLSGGNVTILLPTSLTEGFGTRFSFSVIAGGGGANNLTLDAGVGNTVAHNNSRISNPAAQTLVVDNTDTYEQGTVYEYLKTDTGGAIEWAIVKTKAANLMNNIDLAGASNGDYLSWDSTNNELILAAAPVSGAPAITIVENTLDNNNQNLSLVAGNHHIVTLNELGAPLWSASTLTLPAISNNTDEIVLSFEGVRPSPSLLGTITIATTGGDTVQNDNKAYAATWVIAGIAPTTSLNWEALERLDWNFKWRSNNTSKQWQLTTAFGRLEDASDVNNGTVKTGNEILFWNSVPNRWELTAASLTTGANSGLSPATLQFLAASPSVALDVSNLPFMASTFQPTVDSIAMYDNSVGTTCRNTLSALLAECDADLLKNVNDSSAGAGTMLAYNGAGTPEYVAYRHPVGSGYFENTGTPHNVVITIAGTAVEVAPTLTLGVGQQFDLPAGGRVRYTGTPNSYFHVSAHCSALSTLGGVPFSNNSHLELRKNGVKFGSISILRLDANFTVTFAITGTVELATNDYVSLFITNEDTTDNIDVVSLNIALSGVPATTSWTGQAV